MKPKHFLILGVLAAAAVLLFRRAHRFCNPELRYQARRQTARSMGAAGTAGQPRALPPPCRFLATRIAARVRNSAGMRALFSPDGSRPPAQDGRRKGCCCGAG